MGWSDEFKYRDCPWCGTASVAMIPTGLANTTTSVGAHRFWMPMWCPRCGGFVVVEISSQEEVHEVRTVIPSDVDDMKVDHLPEDVANYFSDAKKVLRFGVPDAAAVQLRRTLEAAAAHFEEGDKPRRPQSLMTHINKLVDAGLVTIPFREAMDHVRTLGNIGAHASDQRLSEEDVRRATQFTTQLLRNLFEIPAELRAIGDDEAGEATDQSESRP